MRKCASSSPPQEPASALGAGIYTPSTQESCHPFSFFVKVSLQHIMQFTFTRITALALFAIALTPAIAQHATADGECWQACQQRTLGGFVKSHNSTSRNATAAYIGMQLFEENVTTPFRFVSVNAPNLHRLELSSSNSKLIGKPSRSEVFDVLCSVQQLGGQVVRMYVLSFGNDSSFHIQGQEPAQNIGQQLEAFLPTLTFNEEWFEVLDSILEAASSLGLRVIFPFINMVELEQWGGAPTLSRWSNVSPLDFFSNDITKTLYKQVLAFVLNRRNTITGVLYRDDPAIFGWELGNELFSPTCEDLTPPICGVDRPIRAYPSVPTAWTEEMSNYIREIDSNHLIIDGAYPKNSEVLTLPNIDMLGATYYEGSEDQLVADAAFIGGHKAMLVKEFGLSGSSTYTTVGTILEVVKNDSSIAGALYWSMRGHAAEGGFYWHYEQSVNETGQTVYPSSLHWPGFSAEAPTHETSVFSLLQAASLAVGGPTPPDFVPCTPQVELLSDAFFPPCMLLVGSTGASRYELWVTLDDGSELATDVLPYEQVQESWFRIQRDAHDATAEKSAALSFYVDDNVRSLLGWAGNAWRICATACNSNGNCSACTAPMELTMDVTAPIAPLCLTSFTNTTMAEEDVDYLGRYLFDMDRPAAFWITVGFMFTLAVASFLALLILGRTWVVTACGSAWNTYTGALRSRFHAEQADALCVGNKANFLWAGEFAVLKAFAIAVLIVHCRRHDMHTPTWPASAVVEWSSMSYSFLFVMAGFVLGSEQIRLGANDKSGSSVVAMKCFWRRVAHLGPALIVACIIGFCLSPDSLSGSYLLLPLGISAWFPSIWENDVNSPAWIVGAMAFNGLLLLPVLDALRETKPTKRTRMWLLVACWLATLWQANDAVGQRLFLLDRFLIAVFLRAFAPSFIAGVILASLSAHRDDGPSGILAMPGSSMTAAGAMVLMSLIPLDNDFAAAWVRSGALLPLQALLVYGVASMDAFARILSYLRVPAPTDMFTVLLLQHCVWTFADSVAAGNETLAWILFVVTLPLFAACVDFLVCQPAARIILCEVSKEAKAANPTAATARPAPRSTTENLVLYFCSLVIIVVTFCVAQFYDPWVTVVDLSDLDWLPGALENFSWILLAPAPALLMGLGGLLLYPAVLQPAPTPLSKQIVDETDEIPSGGDTAPFKIHFRIVTRGNNPNLVLGNCESALEVLRSSALPADRWCVEVVTDKAMGLPSKCDITEIVVPSEYSPPGGCKFKARALNYAVHASSAKYDDWLVHLDEETRFDADTVAHIFEHCRKQHRQVQTGASKFPSIGQGVIYYNKAGIENYLTALADTIRVADDYAKFALQYRMFRLPLIGMHGSFVVCCNSLQRDVGWDWGMTGSITEDTYLAMKLAAMGVKFDFCGGNMYEQSPFSCQDFAKQRARWFSGLWLCVVTKTLPLWQRVFLGSHLASWSLCPLLTFVTWINLLTIFPRTEQFIFLMSFVFSIPFWSYCLGFALGFSPSQFKHGRVEWLLLFIMHVTLIPVYTIMETYGVARGICDRKTYVGFHIVQKEGNLVKKKQVQKEGSSVPINQEAEPEGSVDSDVVVEICPSNDKATVMTYWREVFKLHVDPLDLAQTGLPPSSSFTVMDTIELALSHAPTSLLDACASSTSSSPVAVVAASFAAFLRRYTRQEESLLGVSQHDMRLDALPLGTSVAIDSSFASVVAQVFELMQRGRRQSANVDLDDLIEEFGGASKMFQATVAFLDDADEEVEWMAKQNKITDLAVVCKSVNSALQLRASFTQSKFKTESIETLLSSFSSFFTATLANTTGPIKVLPMMSVDARRAAMQSFYRELARGNDRRTTPPSLAELLNRSLATANPEASAIEDPRTGMKLSYAELDQCTRYLSGVLRNNGIGAGDVVVVSAERKIGTVVSLLSVARAGAAYMPVDASYPETRIRFMVEDAGVKLVLCSAEQAQQWDRVLAGDTKGNTAWVAPALHIVKQDLLAEAQSATMPEADSLPVDPSQPAAVLYTSGSTGLPKGVVIPHSAIARQYMAITETTGLCSGDRVAQQTTLTFDVAGNEIWGCVCAQGTLVMVDDASRMLEFESFIAKHAINALFITPSHLGVMSPAACGPSLRTLAMAGEAVPKALIDKWATSSRTFCNEYGPSETNVVTCMRCTPQMKNPASIGFPLPGVPLVIVDEQLEPVPLGVAGELCVAGHQVATGYLNRPELTPTKFVSWRDGAEPDDHRLYRTGDLCRWLPDGSVEFLGRIDSQIKLRGMRVEVGEIESTMLAASNVTQCAVLLLGPSEAAQLIAFVVVDSSKGAWREQDVRAELTRTLPEHMVPSAFQLVDSMPTTTSGKINRKALALMWVPTGNPVVEQTQAADESELPPLPASGGEDLTIGAFLASDRATALRKRGVDSLGMMRQYRALVATEAFAKAEERVVNCIRAVCMLGVIIDHLANCAPASPCTVVTAKVLFPHAGSGTALRNFLLLLETLMRSIGGYKTIAGFSMASGYIDAGGSRPFKLGMMEAAIALIYLEMTWVWDPAVTAISDAVGEDGDYPWWLAQHRWYLLSMLLSRVALVLMTSLRIAPVVQVAVAALVMLLSAPNLICVSTVCAGLPSQSWTDWSAAPQPFNFLLGVFFRGVEPQGSEWPYGGFRYVVARKYLLMVLLYLVSFHCGRPVIKMAVDAWKALQERWRAALTGWSGAAHKAALKLPSMAAGMLSLTLLLASSVWLAGEWGAEEDNWVQEWGDVRNEAHLTRLGLVTVVLILQVLFLVGTFTFIPVSLRTAGTTTLGAFIAHSYCNVVVSELVMNNASLSISPALHYCILLLAAFAIQLFVGPLIHWAVIQHLLLLAKAGSSLLARVPASRSDDSVKGVPSPPPQPTMSSNRVLELESQTGGGLGLAHERASSGSRGSERSFNTMHSVLVISNASNSVRP